MKLKNKVVLITGALGGIGTAIARRFDDEGAQLALADIVEGESPVKAAATPELADIRGSLKPPGFWKRSVISAYP